MLNYDTNLPLEKHSSPIAQLGVCIADPNMKIIENVGVKWSYCSTMLRENGLRLS